MANLEVVTTSKSANESVLQHRPLGAIGRGSALPRIGFPAGILWLGSCQLNCKEYS
jgi:hypothetical protein